MKNKLLIPSQFQGIGDILFSMTLIREFAKGKYKILWPVMPHYLDGCQRAFPDITFVPFTMLNVDYNCKEDYENEFYRYIPIRWSDGWKGRPYTDCMKIKYEMYGMDYRTWKDNAKFERSWKREQGLLATIELISGVRLNINEPYNLVNRYFGSSSQFKVDINIDNDLPTVEMSSIKGYSIFDWSLLIENATNIYAANSSILYLLELLDLKAEEIHLYCRKPIEKDFKNTDYLHTKNYILHD